MCPHPRAFSYNTHPLTGSCAPLWKSTASCRKETYCAPILMPLTMTPTLSQAPVPLCGGALQAQAGLQVGEVYTGTVLTNWHQQDPTTGQKLGHALLGRIQVGWRGLCWVLG